MDEPPRSLPTAYEVAAARWAIGLLGGTSVSVSEARAAYRRSVSGATFTENELEEGEALLLRAGLLIAEGGRLHKADGSAPLDALDDRMAARAVIARLLERDPPVWLRVAAGGSEMLEALIPEAETNALELLFGEDTPLRDAMLRVAVRRSEQIRLDGITAKGVGFVAAACRAELEDAGRGDLADRVLECRSAAPALACDVLAPAVVGDARRLLVKTTLRLDARMPIVLSRDEIEVGLADLTWALVVCAIDEGQRVELIGWCRAEALSGLVPADQHAHGRWLVMSLLMVQPLLTPGLPPG